VKMDWVMYVLLGIIISGTQVVVVVLWREAVDLYGVFLDVIGDIMQRIACLVQIAARVLWASGRKIQSVGKLIGRVS